jgi:hypothetical protein
MTQQVNVATVVGTITGSGNAAVIITSAVLPSSPKTLSIPVLITNTPAIVAQAIRYALATDTDISALFVVGGTGANVQLTSRVDAANDATLNIDIDNDTCTGLTDAPTSTTTVQGVAVITNGYCTLAEFKAYGLSKAQTSIADDATICLLIESASREAEHVMRRTYFTTAGIHYFDTPLANQTPPIGNYLTSPTNPTDTILFYDDLQSLTSITNGDGSVIPSTAYILLPYQGAPYFGVRLRPTAGIAWNTNQGDPLGAIQVSGDWGADTVPDADLKEAVMMVVKEAYNRRSGENMSSKSILTPGGVIVTPDDIPEKAMETFLSHRRVSFG